MVSPHTRVLVPILFALLALMLLAGGARAATARTAFDGGTARERSQVHAALTASSFDWSLLPPVTVHVLAGTQSRSLPGEVWLDANLLHAGSFAWAVVQEEFAHQVDFLLLDPAKRAQLAGALGAGAWFRFEAPGLAHDDYGSERFAAAFVWSYWPSRLNAFGPAPVQPAAFRALVGGLVGSTVS